MAIQKDVISPNDEHCKVIDRIAKDPYGRRAIIVQHPTGVKFCLPVPKNDSLFSPWMIDYCLQDSFGEPENKKQKKTFEATRGYFNKIYEMLEQDGGGSNYIYGDFSKEFEGFYHGYMSALTGKIDMS